ncbi:MAG TPA: PA14 domain-containing protein [Phycisphaerae bacterium]|nr:PA14 domain-containing protein [Phycisphaerae bacterium]HRW52265.1 PA14 domain-containing protein [Phycisphaerae bacterium]
MSLNPPASPDTTPSPRTTIDLAGADWKLWLDRDAKWRDDIVHAPGVDLSGLPARPPSCGWASLSDAARDVCVPGTVEGLCWDELGGDYVGVSWWCRDVDLPATLADRRLTLEFSAVRQRAEVFLNDELVGYDAIGNTPFNVDLTGRAKAGRNRLAIRITDPGGNFDWRDYNVLHWGGQTIPLSHGFGGITGGVRLVATDAIRIDDVFVRNTPAMTDIRVELGVSNTLNESVTTDLRVTIRDALGEVAYEQVWPNVRIEPGDQSVARDISVPQADLWRPESPTLYVATIDLGGRDRVDRRFGFRWFEVDGAGPNAVFRLNGKRIVLRSAISWGFWPITGIFPTPEMARANVRIARALGLNMLNLHRCIGDDATFDAADELGLLIFEEPGGYTSHGGDDKCFAFAREKLLRMVRRDRSRPSLVIYNMINEETAPPVERHRRDMADAHRLDPTRTILYTSGWAKDGDDPIKLHMRPLEDVQRTIGWYDVHHAPGPGVYRDSFYNGPGDFRWRRDERGEIVFWGEEGAIATPPRLQRIVDDLREASDGWDGRDYRDWHAAFERFLDQKNLRTYFPSVDMLTETLGDVAFYYQGRVIENIRASDTTDGYVVNGWESEKYENHSGIVDCFRNPKGRPDLLAQYSKPLLLAVKLRNKVGAVPMTAVCDVYVVNEVDLRGDFELTLMLRTEDGRQRWRNRFDVTISGGDRYGELLLRDLAIRADAGPGRYVLLAELRGKADGLVADSVVASGSDELFLVDRSAAKGSARGALIDTSGAVARYLQVWRGGDLATFQPDMPTLDYIILGDGDDLLPSEPVPAELVTLPDGSGEGLAASYFRGWEFESHVLDRIDRGVQHDFGTEGPDPRVGRRDYSVRWRGRLTPTVTGPYLFHADHDDGVRVFLDGREIIGHWDPFAAPRNDRGRAVELVAGQSYDLRIDYFQSGGGARMRLLWTTPDLFRRRDALISSLVKRVREDGTTLLVVSQADQWAELLAHHGAVEYDGRMNHGRFWLGGSYFVRSHPLFDGLPVNCGMNWEYQEIVNYDRRRFGLHLRGEEVVAGCVTGSEHEVATAVGIVRCGNGQIVLSTLDLLPMLNEPLGPADVARAIFDNYLRYAGG